MVYLTTDGGNEGGGFRLPRGRNRYDSGVLGEPEQATRWRRLAPWYDAVLIAGLTVALVSWVLDRAADLDLASWLSIVCLMALTVAIRPFIGRLVA